MKALVICLIFMLCSCSVSNRISQSYILGEFLDDYEIAYSISDSVWIQEPGFELKIIEFNSKNSYLLTYQDSDSTYTKIDFMKFENQGDYKWGFCYTSYDKRSQEEVLLEKPADRKNPKSGCNGFPFSRMKAKH